MRVAKQNEVGAVEAVAKHFSATWEAGKDASRAYIRVGKKRVCVDVAVIKSRRFVKPRLRFDKVVLRLVGDLQESLGAGVPDGEVVIWTVAAPIRLPAKTAAAMDETIRTCLARKAARIEIKEVVHGNRVRIRLVKGGLKGTSKVIGFVHNPESDSGVLLDVTQALLECISAAARKPRPARFAGERWLVLHVDEGRSYFETCRQIYSQLSLTTGFKKILMVLADGTVETLSD